jgi:cytochrome c oxidase assembly protein subunit 19
MNVSLNKSSAVKPPERGSFPLDHGDAKCGESRKAYMACMKAAKFDQQACKGTARAYLECRMAASLMAPDNLDEIGFEAKEDRAASADARAPR